MSPEPDDGRGRRRSTPGAWLALVIAEGAGIAVFAFLLASREGRVSPERGHSAPGAAAVTSSGREAAEDSALPGAAIPTAPFDPGEGGGNVGESPDDGLGIVLFGRIDDASGRPLEHVRVTVLDDVDEPMAAPVQSQARGYALSGLRPGAFVVKCEKRDFLTLEQPLRLEARPARRRLDLRLERKPEIVVKATTPAGTSVHAWWEDARILNHHGPTVVATRDRPQGETVDQQVLDASPWPASFQEDLGGTQGKDHGLRVGSLIASRPPPWFTSLVLGSWIIDTQPVGPGQAEVTFIVDPGRVMAGFATLGGRAVDSESGRPVQVAVEIFIRTGSARQETTEDGRFGFNRLVPGPVSLFVGSGDHARRRLALQVAAAKDMDLGDIRIERECTISGAFVDQSGAPVHCMFGVGNMDDPHSEHPMGPIGISRATHPDGQFKITGHGRGRWLVRAQVRAQNEAGPIVAAIADTTSGSVSGLRLTVPRLGAELAIAPELPRDGYYHVEILDGSGLALERKRASGRRRVRFTVVPGNYRIELRQGGRVLKTVSVAVPAAGATVPLVP